jgi:ABC-type transport system substrate-binding protein
VKLAFPYPAVVRYLAWNWLSNVMPIEADGKFDARQEMRGAGPWMMTAYNPSQSVEYKRNPNWYDAGTKRPYLDGINYALLSETAAREAQFRSKTLWYLVPNPEGVATMKRELPEALLRANTPLEGNAGNTNLTLSKLPNQPLTDARVRHAISLLIDRDAYLNTFGNLDRLKAEGLPAEAYWNTHCPCSWGTIWLDPKTGKLGEQSKWFQFNPNEAAALLRAAGKYGVTLEFAHRNDGTAEFNRQMDVIKAMLQEGGHVKLDVKTGAYATWFQPTYNRGSGQYQGMAPTPQGGFPDFDGVLWGTFAPGSRNDSIGAWENVPGLREIMLRHRQEGDEKKRLAIQHEWQRFMADQMPTVPMPGEWTTFDLNWPWLENYRVQRTWMTNGNAADVFPYMWYNKSKDTRAS